MESKVNKEELKKKRELIKQLFEEQFIPPHIKEEIDALIVYAQLLDFNVAKVYLKAVYNATDEFMSGDELSYRFSKESKSSSTAPYFYLHVELNDNMKIDEKFILNNIKFSYNKINQRLENESNEGSW